MRKRKEPIRYLKKWLFSCRGGAGGEEDARQAEPDEEGQVGGDFLAEIEGAQGEGGAGEGEQAGGDPHGAAAAPAVRRGRIVLHPHREADTAGGSEEESSAEAQ